MVLFLVPATIVIDFLSNETKITGS